MKMLTPVEIEVLKRLELTPKINSVDLLQEKILRINTVIKHREEIIKNEQLRISLLKRDIEALQEDLRLEKNEVSNNLKELNRYKEALKVKYNLENNWGYNPDNGELT
jgi:hypothetical protein